MNKLVSVAAAAAMLALAPLSAQAGSCTYIQKSVWAGPFRVCDMPADPARCETLGQTDDNSDAQHAEGSCDTAEAIGICTIAEVQRHYYEGDPRMLEIGCGFQGGDWQDGAAGG